MSKQTPDGVICYWQIKKLPASHRGTGWELVEAYPIDGDGYALTTPKNTGKLNPRQEWQNWINRLVGEGIEEHCEEIMGRAVTSWHFGDGVTLLGFHPPAWVSWLAPTFYTNLREKQNWLNMLDGALILYFGTIEQARKIMGSDV